MILKKISFISLVICIVLFSLSVISDKKVTAITAADWKAGYIIDDTIFTDPGSMSVAQIQAFLDNKVGTGTNGIPGQCDTNGVRMSELSSYTITRAQYGIDNNNPAPFTCLKDFYEVPKTEPGPIIPENNYGGKPIPAGAKSAAELIWDAAQTYRISPKVLLVKIATESAGPLTSDDWPFLRQYTYAMGSHCPDSGPGGTANCDTDYAGFSIQMHSAASLLRWYLDNMTQAWWSYKKPYQTNSILWNIVESGCGAGNVYIEDMATAALYTYTPYQPNAAALNNMYGTGDGCSAYGNRNFWRVFNDWFGPSRQGRFSPLFKSDTSDVIYAIFDNKKHAITSFEVMNAFGLSNFATASVSDTFLSGFETGTSISKTLAKKEFDLNGTIYLFDDGKRYPVKINDCKSNPDGSPVINTSWSIDCFNQSAVLTLPNRLIDTYTVQDIDVPDVILYQNTAWKIQDGKKRRILDPLIVDVLGGWGKARWMKDINAQQVEGKLLMRNGYTIRFTDSDLVYRYDNDNLHKVLSISDFVAWGFEKQPVHLIPSSYNTPEPLPIAEDVSHIAIISNKYYLVDKGNKMYLGTALTSQWPTNNAVSIDETLNSLVEIPLSSIYLAEGGSIFTVYQNKKYIYPTMDDFIGLKANPLLIRRVSPEVINLPGLVFGGFHLADGRLFKINNGSGQIYRVNGGTSQLVNSCNYPDLPYNKLIIVDPITAQRYPVNGEYLP